MIEQPPQRMPPRKRTLSASPTITGIKMPPSAESQSPASAIRLVYGSLLLGQLLFAGVTMFIVRPTITDAGTLPDSTAMRLFAVSIVACAAALLLRRRVPARPQDVSADLYWSTAQPQALMAWIPLEGAGLYALVAYFQSGAPVALLAAAIPVALLVVLNPWLLERR